MITKVIRSLFALALVVLIALMLASCGDGSSNSGDSVEVLRGVVVQADSESQLARGAFAELGSALSDVEIVAFNQSTVTDQDGFFSFFEPAQNVGDQVVVSFRRGFSIVEYVISTVGDLPREIKVMVSDDGGVEVLDTTNDAVSGETSEVVNGEAEDFSEEVAAVEEEASGLAEQIEEAVEQAEEDIIAEATCADGFPIPSSALCDGVVDCADLSDEALEVCEPEILSN